MAASNMVYANIVGSEVRSDRKTESFLQHNLKMQVSYHTTFILWNECTL